MTKQQFREADIGELLQMHRGVNAAFRGGLISHEGLSALARIKESYVAIQNDPRNAIKPCHQHVVNWIDVLSKKEISAGPFFSVIDDGIAFSGIDSNWCKRKGWAKDNFLKALSEYCHLQGQPGNARLSEHGTQRNGINPSEKEE